MFDIGAKVQVVNVGFTYSTYKEWAKVHGLEKYRDGVRLDAGADFTVIARGFHEFSGQGIIYGITDGKRDYIIGEEGLKLATEPVQYEGLWYGYSEEEGIWSDEDYHCATAEEALNHLNKDFGLHLKKKHIHKVNGSKRKVEVNR